MSPGEGKARAATSFPDRLGSPPYVLTCEAKHSVSATRGGLVPEFGFASAEPYFSTFSPLSCAILVQWQMAAPPLRSLRCC